MKKEFNFEKLIEITIMLIGLGINFYFLNSKLEDNKIQIEHRLSVIETQIQDMKK